MHQISRRHIEWGRVLLPFYQLFALVQNIPPITLSCIGLQIAIFLRLFHLPWHDPSQVCISAYDVWKKKEFTRLLYGALEHGNGWHLYYNMISFFMKGHCLERRFESVKFLYIVSVFTVVTSTVLVALKVLVAEFPGLDDCDQCVVGFSGVIFALKVLTTRRDKWTSHGVPRLPIMTYARYAVWVELLLIQIVVPKASFLEHLAGILVGIAYISGPLRYIMDVIYSVITGNSGFLCHTRFTEQSERNGYRSDVFVPPGMTEEEQLRRAMEESIEASVRPHPNTDTSGDSVPSPEDFVYDENFPVPSSQGFASD